MSTTIRNPVEWSAEQLKAASHHLESVGKALGGDENARGAQPVPQQVSLGDLWDALMKGSEDFKACRSDVAFLCIIYPIAGLCLIWLAFDQNLLPLLVPIVSGFALVGPVAAIGLYELSRQRETGAETNWATALGVLGSPSFGAIFGLGLMLLGIFAIWLFAAQGIYNLTLGPEPPASAGAFVGDVLTTAAGWAMIILGMVTGACFAFAVMAISVVSFPLLLDRPVGLPVAVVTSVRVVLLSPREMTVWGLIVASGLMVGSLPLFLGLLYVMPILGHATWHLYRKAVIHGDEEPGSTSP